MELLNDKALSFGSKIKELYNIDSFETEMPMITIEVTSDCCCMCKYCFEEHKEREYMDIETAQKIIDVLFQMYEDDNPDVVINKSTKGLVVSLIGGEPFLNMPVVEYITSTMINKCIEEDHPWLPFLRFMITTNGAMYFTPQVQEYINKYEHFLDIAVSLDGPKAIHNKNRIYKNHKGNFDDAYAAFQDWSKEHFNAARPTISANNIDNLTELFEFFIFDLDVCVCHCAFDNMHTWTTAEAARIYQQMKKIADDMLEKDIQLSRRTSLFLENLGMEMKYKYPETKEVYLACLKMPRLCFTPNGAIYPCLRLSASSINEASKLFDYGMHDGTMRVDINKYNALKTMYKRDDDPECKTCHLQGPCGCCIGPNVDEGHIERHSKSRCWVIKAQCLASSYYFNQYYKKHNMKQRFIIPLSKEQCLNLISEEEYEMLKGMEK